MCAAGLLLAGCTAAADGAAPPSDSPSAPSPDPSPVAVGATELGAALVQYRRDAQRDVLQVKVTNPGEEPVTVRRVQLDSATFTAPVVADKDSVVGPGLTVDLTVDLPGAACDGRDEAPVAVELTVLDAAGEEHVVRLDTARGGAGGTTGSLADGSGADVLAEVQARRCAAITVAEHVRLSTDPEWVDGGPLPDGTPTLLGALVAEPVPGGGPVALVVQGATTLFTFVTAADASLAAGAEETVRLPLRVRVTRCDPHAVAEDKKGYLVPVRASLDGAEPLLVEVAVPVPERAALQGLIDASCA